MFVASLLNPFPADKSATSPTKGEVIRLLRYTRNDAREQGVVLNSVFNTSALDVIFRRERSELSGESSNIISIFFKQMYQYWILGE